jgi:hypothetical protein
MCRFPRMGRVGGPGGSPSSRRPTFRRKNAMQNAIRAKGTKMAMLAVGEVSYRGFALTGVKASRILLTGPESRRFRQLYVSHVTERTNPGCGGADTVKSRSPGSDAANRNFPCSEVNSVPFMDRTKGMVRHLWGGGDTQVPTPTGMELPATVRYGSCASPAFRSAVSA